jgi:hypothetical protein
VPTGSGQQVIADATFCFGDTTLLAQIGING